MDYEIGSFLGKYTNMISQKKIKKMDPYLKRFTIEIILASY